MICILSLTWLTRDERKDSNTFFYNLEIFPYKLQISPENTV